MMVRFLIYAMFGWCAEIVWTASYDVVSAVAGRRRVDLRLTGRTYLWMFPIYGAGGLLFEQVHAAIATWPWVARGLIYLAGCWAVEYVSGWLIKRATGKIPWDYSYAKWHLHGLIRWDYAPVWFLFGLGLEVVEMIARKIEPVLRST